METNPLIKQAFPEGKVLTWYSGLIRIDDDRGEYEDEEPGMKFEYLQIKHGKLITRWALDYDELQVFKETLWEHFITTEAYRERYGLWHRNNPKLPDIEINEYIYKDLLRYVEEF
jgi:hypothetical protein